MTESGRSIRDLLEWARLNLKSAGVQEHRLEGELLLQHVLNIDAARMFAGLNESVLSETDATPRREVTRRADREPLAYTTGRRGFYGRSFDVPPDVRIRRAGA